ncbi:MAG: ATP-binding protein, partial [Bacteroidota bacterium]
QIQWSKQMTNPRATSDSVLIGRKQELKQLRACLTSRKSEFIAVYGRRRVGKTFLIRKAFDNQFAFQLTGLANVGMKHQLGQFHAALSTSATQVQWQPEPATDWFVAFRQLSAYLEKLPLEEKKVVFLDELPWLDTRKSYFLSGLEHFWNSWASAREDIVLIVCGSAASWMLNHLIKNRGGLHNRVTGRIKLAPFSLAETEAFLHEKGAIYNRYQTLLLYMTFGGIPFFLDFVQAEKSAMQNINDLCFGEHAPFRIEYENLYASLFNRHERHVAIVEALATKGKGLTRKELIQRTAFSDGGGLTRILQELEESNFIRKYRAFGKKKNEALYQLVDVYSLFYLKFIQTAAEDDEQYWLNTLETPGFFAWAGYAFEMVCLHHIPQIKKRLGISGVQTSVSTWQSPEAQIDLVIDRKDQVINLCEMKFSIHEFAIDKRYAATLRNKQGSFRQSTRTKKALFLTMITTYGVAQNQYAGMIRNELDMNALFE